MEFEQICHPNIYEIRVYNSKIETANAFAQHAIIGDVKKFPSLPITNATGDTMLPIDTELKRAVDAGEVSFEQVLAYHLDEYHPYSPGAQFSFVKFLRDNIFKPLHIPQRNIFTLNGLATNPVDEANRYDELVTKHKIGLAILGIGPGGHIGFNEAGTSFNSRTHLQVLSEETYKRDTIERGQDTPKTALTQGISTILEADRIVLVAYGRYKGQILRKALFEDISTDCPASALRLQGHKVSIFVDKEAASEIILGIVV
ncbi:MAG: glucosamine-6-phosphate deaminase [Candidatus Woesebacteria bacterium]|nr:glucosamine-6-phosphate deaminase [Candidatus Woesebacteria bacterium]